MCSSINKTHHAVDPWARLWLSGKPDYVCWGTLACMPSEHQRHMSWIGTMLSPVMVLQAATAYQHDIARSLGLPSHKVVCHVKRVGGAFGGKETRFIPVTAAAAVAAREINHPVRIALDRHEDMAITGHRHPFFIKYKVSCCR